MFNLFKRKERNFKFTEPENTACFVCEHVLNRQRPILYASHEEGDGSWQFLCGTNDHTESNAKIISLKQATEIDDTINDLYAIGSRSRKRNANFKMATISYWIIPNATAVLNSLVRGIIAMT